MQTAYRWHAAVLAFTIVLTGWTAFAEPRELRVPLEDGQLSLSHLESLGISIPPWTRSPRVDVRGVSGWLVVRGINKALGEGCNVAVTDQAIVIRYDTDRLPQDVNQAKDAAQVFAAEVAPESTAAQQRMFGLLLPKNVDPARPIVVMVHGLDCNRENWQSMADLVESEGYQAAYFAYPSDQPIERSAAMFGEQMTVLREEFPHASVHIIAHSMGSLVARAYIEGDIYAGGVDRLLLIAPPNHGSRWALFRSVLEAREHYHLWQNNEEYSPTWIITDGLGQAGEDLLPGSDFLLALNRRPRRDGVRYTIITGDRHEGWRIAGDAIASTSSLIPGSVSQHWGLRHLNRGIQDLAVCARDQENGTDGPVSIESAKLAGVDDFILLHADHTALYAPVSESAQPAAWPVIRERLLAE